MLKVTEETVSHTAALLCKALLANPNHPLMDRMTRIFPRCIIGACMHGNTRQHDLAMREMEAISKNCARILALDGVPPIEILTASCEG